MKGSSRTKLFNDQFHKSCENHTKIVVECLYLALPTNFYLWKKIIHQLFYMHYNYSEISYIDQQSDSQLLSLI